MARTMSDAAEERLRRNAREYLCLGTDDTNAILAELDAERAAHAETKAAWKAALDAHRDRETETKLECMRKMDALKARLALAEAVCESCGEDWDEEFGGFDLYDHDALAAWRAAK